MQCITLRMSYCKSAAGAAPRGAAAAGAATRRPRQGGDAFDGLLAEHEAVLSDLPLNVRPPHALQGRRRGVCNLGQHEGPRGWGTSAAVVQTVFKTGSADIFKLTTLSLSKKKKKEET